jgi:GT2 family glycosyltransferase
VFNPVPGTTEFRLDEPVEVQEAGTGFMMMHKGVFSKYAEAFPELSYRPDHVRTTAFDGSREIHAYFDCIIDPDTRRYLSEDYMFCYNVRKIGMKVWMCPWMKLKHMGSYTFGGSLAALAAIAASPTASAESNSKNYLTKPAADANLNRSQRRANKKGK